MDTLTDAIQNLKNALKDANRTTELKENYEILQTKDSYLDSRWASTIVGIANKDEKSFDAVKLQVDKGDLHHLEDYPAKALQAAWNVATILAKINVESHWPSAGTAQTIFKLAYKASNGETNMANLQNSLDYLDTINYNGVPHIIDDVTYKINLAINNFITEIALIPQGKNLINASQPLGTLSFSNMQKAAQERIASYEMYLTLHKQTAPEERGTNEPLSIDEDEGEFMDAQEGPSDTQLKSSKDYDDEVFYDAPEESQAEINAKSKIIESFNTFAEQILNKLNLRGTNDPEQTQRCQDAISFITDIKKEIVEDKSLDSIQKYLADNDAKINEKFSENRSQTWFREYISEPFKLFKTAVNNCFKACGFKEPFVNDTLKKFLRFKEQFNLILCEEKIDAAKEKNVSQVNSRSLHQ